MLRAALGHSEFLTIVVRKSQIRASASLSGEVAIMVSLIHRTTLWSVEGIQFIVIGDGEVSLDAVVGREGEGKQKRKQREGGANPPPS